MMNVYTIVTHLGKMCSSKMICVLLVLTLGGIEAGLRDKAKQIYIGTAASVVGIGDPDEAAMAGKEFNMLTPANELKWDTTEKTRYNKNYTLADTIVKYAQENDMRIRGHCLVWHSQLPDWLKTLGKMELLGAMQGRIRDIVGYYKGKLYAWDVVNEVVESNGSLRDSIWTHYFGESFISEAFNIANEVDSSVKLYINDYGIEDINPKSTGLYNLVKKLKAKGVPIDGVGFQMHIFAGEVPSSFQDNLKRFTDLGVEVAITEMDVAIKLPSNTTSLQQQAKDCAGVVEACQAVKGCVGISFWGVSDKHSWIPSVHPGYGDALLFDNNFKPKPAVAAMEAVLK